MSIIQRDGRCMINISDGEPVNRHKPSVNVLFNSVAEHRGNEAVGIILTGMGDDGASGLLAMHQRGSFTIAQDEQTSVVFGMPYKAICSGGVSTVLPLDAIGQTIIQRFSN
jgi:two-component system chemotaxis response regulator CheB